MNSFKAFALVGLAGACVALTSTALGAGADIKHSGLAGSISKFGPVGGIHAYSLGSNTCNMGDSSLSWINNGTPSLAMNAYRLHNGRLVQIGLGNAKTACCVANGSSPLCAPLSCSASGFGLRPGCIDTYSAGWNSGQGRLAPRSYINPQTGATDTSYVHNSGDAIYRRLQVQQADMEAANFPGALYFVEGHYICDEDADANNDLNNASYGRVTVDGSFNLTSAGTFNVGIPAIYAWRDHGLGANTPDPNVIIQNVDIPNEGRFIVGHKVTDNGNGTWRYEYAVQNFNSDRAGGSFAVAIPPGTKVTGIGYSAPNYHSGEIYSNADWASPNPDSFELRWASAPFPAPPAVDNGNALRWGTLSSYWFTCDRAPVAGHAELGLYKPAAGCQPTKGSIALSVPAADCLSDIVRTGAVNVDDMLAVIDGWGARACQFTCAPDVVVNGQVDVDDLLAVIEGWGECP